MADTQHDTLQPLAHQVAGHPGSIMTAGDGSIIVKPSLPLEIEFYSRTAPEHFPELAEKGLVCRYYGTEAHTTAPKEGKVKLEQAIRLENISHGFQKPNIIDLKLGTRLFDALDPNLTPDKQARMEAEAARTTSGSDGVRLTGFSVYDAKTDDWVRTPKEYGKSIPSSELVHGFRRFTPAFEEKPDVHTHSDLTPAPPSGLRVRALIPMLKAILADVQQYFDTVKKYEWRVAGGSLLIVYEGQEGAPAKHAVKMIDFAHARHLPGDGPDEGLLRGVQTVIQLLEGRIQELENLA